MRNYIQVTSVTYSFFFTVALWREVSKITPGSRQQAAGRLLWTGVNLLILVGFCSMCEFAPAGFCSVTPDLSAK